MTQLDFKKLKESFLNNNGYTEGSISNIKNILFNKQTIILEEKLNKDLCQFNLDEIKILLGNIKSMSLESIRKNKSIISKYIDYANINNYINTNINFAQEITEEDLKNLVYKMAIQGKYITEEELEYICDTCLNPQDEVIFRLLFEGVKGEEASEILDLEILDVDKENNIINIRGKNARQIKINQRTIDTIIDAINQTVYESYITDKINITRGRFRKIYPNEYVVRKARKNAGKVKYSGLQMKFRKVKEYAGFKFITIETVWWSGMLHQAKKIEQENGVITDQDYARIAKKFGYENVDYNFMCKIKRLIKKYG